ncbi:MAG: hypothetical protein B6I20_11725 [Bacteroidetes bacterium 4572_117]|nr:MAG: hypothetical protein B6I20_11725 [Bacteroidetes bacterium 4572_117]
MKILFTVISIVLWASVCFSQTKIETKANISKLVIYTSSAEMHYTKSVSLTKGKNTIVFTDLTPYIVENSINVNVLDKSVNIITIADKINYLKPSYNNDVLVLIDSIVNNEYEIELVESQIEVMEKEKGLLFKDESIGGVSKGVAVSEIEKASQFFHKRYTYLNKGLLTLKRKKLKLSKINNKIGLQLKELSTISETGTSEITVVVFSQTAKKVDINLKMLTPNAGWAPLYDIKYNGPDKELQFIFRANVFNATNIDWNNVKIKLSTASPTSGFSIPSFNKKNNTNKEQINYGDRNVKFKEIQTNGILTEYNIDFKYTIPSDAKPYLIDVDNFMVKSGFSYIVIPKLEKNGFLIANIPNWNKYNIISGSTNIYNNGIFLGKSFLNTVTDNDTLEIYLGKDNNIITSRKEHDTEYPRNIIGNHFVDKTSINISITNLYNKKISIKLIDRIPVMEDRYRTKMDVFNIESAIYDKKSGITEWYFAMLPKEKKVLDYSYKIKAPKEFLERVYQLKRKNRQMAIPCPDF